MMGIEGLGGFELHNSYLIPIWPHILNLGMLETLI